MHLKRFLRTNLTLFRITLIVILISAFTMFEVYRCGYFDNNAGSSEDNWPQMLEGQTRNAFTIKVGKAWHKGMNDDQVPVLTAPVKRHGSPYPNLSTRGNLRNEQKSEASMELVPKHLTTNSRQLELRDRPGYQVHCKKREIVQRYPVKAVERACKPHKPPEEACKLASQLYQIDPGLQTCQRGLKAVYCSLQAGDALEFSCFMKHKYKSCKIGVLNYDMGEIYHIRVRNVDRLEKELEMSAKTAMSNDSNFLFLKCFRDEAEEPRSQLILLPFANHVAQSSRQKPDVNIVLLDSIARAHFYRSLPVVLDTFNEINMDSKMETEVLDFELFQSVHGHSAENFHAFFTGKLFAKNLTETVKERSSVGIGDLYGVLRSNGYETLYQDDVCWKQWWGMRLELGAPQDWKAMREAIKSACIDNTGLSFASCKILSDNNLKSPFNGPEDSKICFNGRFQHAYYFKHLLQYFSERNRGKRRPRIGFTTINTGHDYKGLRIQTLNRDLAGFVRKLARRQNVLTILMADHGNTYTKYTSAVLEGRFEMHHPSLFMIIPPGVKSYLGEDAMKALRLNTKRLLTMIDLRKTVLAIAKGNVDDASKDPGSNMGLIGEISAGRQCDDLELALPNLCVCEGWDSPAKNDTKQVGIVEFAVGTLNNMIDSQVAAGGGTSEYTLYRRKCNRLFATGFSNVRERSSGTNLITTLDFTVPSGSGSGQQEEVFHVEVQSTIGPKLGSRRMKLLTYDRLSQYGIYRECKDSGVNIKLCICSLKGSGDSQQIWGKDGFHLDGLVKAISTYRNIPTNWNIKTNMEQPCIFYLTKNFPDTNGKDNSIFFSVIEIINSCQNSDFQILVDIRKWNCRPSGGIPVPFIVKKQTIQFVGVIMRDVWYWDSSYSFDANAAETT